MEGEQVSFVSDETVVELVDQKEDKVLCFVCLIGWFFFLVTGWFCFPGF